MIAPSDLRRDRLVALRQRRQASLSHLRRAEERTGYLFVLPLLIGFLLFVAGPLIAVLLFGLQERSLLSPIATFVGLENYRSIVLDGLT
jgi:multiple sugar transport system permease protein